MIGPRAEVIVGVPQASVATAAPGAGTPVGLQPRLLPGGQKVNTGGVTSTVQVNVCVQVELLPQASVAVYVLVCERWQPLEVIEPSAEVMVGTPQSSVAEAAPGPGTPVGLQPKSLPGGQKVNTGGVESIVQLKVLVQVLVSPQASAVMVMTRVRVQPFTIIGPSLQVIFVTGPHSLFAKICPPNCAFWMLAQVGSNVGLQPKFIV